jgi:hypothetical protein
MYGPGVRHRQRPQFDSGGFRYTATKTGDYLAHVARMVDVNGVLWQRGPRELILSWNAFIERSGLDEGELEDMLHNGTATEVAVAISATMV